MPAVDRDLADRGERSADAGVVDEHVELAGLGDGKVHHRLHLVRVGHVDGYGQGRAAGRGDLGHLGAAGVLFEIGDDDGGTAGRQLFDDGRVDAQGPAGDDCGLSIEFEIRDVLLSALFSMIWR